MLSGTSAQWCVGTFTKWHIHGTDGRTDRRTGVMRKWPPNGGLETCFPLIWFIFDFTHIIFACSNAMQLKTVNRLNLCLD